MQADELAMLERQAQICQALSDPKRLRLLYALAAREQSVGELAEELGISVANASQHLGILKGRGLVTSHREGTTVFYRLAYPETMEACKVLRGILIQQLAGEARLASTTSEPR